MITHLLPSFSGETNVADAYAFETLFLNKGVNRMYSFCRLMTDLADDHSKYILPKYSASRSIAEMPARFSAAEL